MLLVDSGNDVDDWSTLSVQAQDTLIADMGADAYDALSVTEKRAKKQALITQNAFYFNHQREFIKTLINKWKALDDDKTRLGKYFWSQNLTTSSKKVTFYEIIVKVINFMKPTTICVMVRVSGWSIQISKMTIRAFWPRSIIGTTKGVFIPLMTPFSLRLFQL